jgi:hypothetical protein
VEAAALAQSPRGWTYAEGVLTVKDNDRFEPARFTIH